MSRRGNQIRFFIQANPKSNFDDNYLLDTEWLMEEYEAYFPLIHAPHATGPSSNRPYMRFFAYTCMKDEELGKLGIRAKCSPYLTNIEEEEPDEMDTFLSEMGIAV
jgi:hypothetical protein